MTDAAREVAGSTNADQGIGSTPVAVSFFVDPTNPESGPFGRPFALVRALPGFMNQSNVTAHIPNIAQQPQSTIMQVVGRFGQAAQLAKIPHAGRPTFDSVRDPQTLRMLDRVVAESPMQAGLDNLIGFEWIEIAPIIAGRLLTGREPAADLIPSITDEAAVARFCVFSFSDLPPVQIDQSTVSISSAVPIRPELAVISGRGAKDRDGLGAVELTVRLSIHPVVDPIHVLVVGRRTIALSGIERLVALHRAGAPRALCCVHYGYGIEVLTRFPTTPRELIDGDRPPLVPDFLENSVSVAMPARIHRTSIGISLNVMAIS